MNAPPRRIERPARVEALARRLGDAPRAAEVLAVVSELSSAIRGHVVASRALPAGSSDRVAELVEAVRLRERLDWYVAHELGEADDPLRGRRALASMADKQQRLLAKLLGVPFDERSRAVLESFAAEHQEQGRLFDEIATGFGFVESVALGVREGRGCLALTHNGSLFQLSAPMDPQGGRRFVYQNIYGNQAVASEGRTTLRQPIALGRSIDAKGLHSSPIRKLRLAPTHGDWAFAKQTFAHMTAALGTSPLLGLSDDASEPSANGPATRRDTAWGAISRWFSGRPAEPRDAAPRSRATSAPRAARSISRSRAELRVLSEQLRAGVRAATLDVEIVGLCLHLQSERTRAGEPSLAVELLGGLDTEHGERLVLDPATGKLRIDRPGIAPIELDALRVGEQRIVRGAPLALLDRAGEVALLLGPITQSWGR